MAAAFNRRLRGFNLRSAGPRAGILLNGLPDAERARLATEHELCGKYSRDDESLPANVNDEAAQA